jgi:hypothetical protein
MIAIERLTVGNESVVVVDDGSVSPIASPTMPSPIEASEESDPETYSE